MLVDRFIITQKNDLVSVLYLAVFLLELVNNYAKEPKIKGLLPVILHMFY